MRRFAIAALLALALLFASGSYARAQEHAQPAAQEHAEHAEEEKPKQFNFSDFSKSEPRPYLAALLNFAILLFIYYRFGKKPVMNALKARRAEVAKEIEEAQRLRKEAEERAKQYQAKLGRLEEELATARQALVEAGKGERERIIKEADEKAARMRKDAEFLILQEMKQVKQDLWRDTVELAVGAAEELLKHKITPADQERIAEEYLKDLSEGQSGGPS